MANIDIDIEVELDTWSMLIAQSILDEVSHEEAIELFSMNRAWMSDDIRMAHKEEIVEMDAMLKTYIEQGKEEALALLESA